MSYWNLPTEPYAMGGHIKRDPNHTNDLGPFKMTPYDTIQDLGSWGKLTYHYYTIGYYVQILDTISQFILFEEAEREWKKQLNKILNEIRNKTTNDNPFE